MLKRKESNSNQNRLLENKEVEIWIWLIAIKIVKMQNSIGLGVNTEKRIEGRNRTEERSLTSVLSIGGLNIAKWEWDGKHLGAFKDYQEIVIRLCIRGCCIFFLL